MARHGFKDKGSLFEKSNIWYFFSKDAKYANDTNLPSAKTVSHCTPFTDDQL